MSRIIQVKDIAELNLSTYKKDEFPTIFKYLDTSSLTKNKIQSFQVLDTATDIIPSRAQRKIKQNTILYSTVRPNQEHYGIIERLLDDVVVSTGFTTIDVSDGEIYPKYLFYLLTQNHITDYLHTIATNSVSAYPSLSPNDIGNLKFRVPEYSTQKKIASVLSALDSKIELNNRINVELEAMAKTIYDYWFVQFDFPFDFAQGKPDKNGRRSEPAELKPYKSSGGKMVWNEELKREIPEGWQDGVFADYCPSTGGFAFKSSWWSDKGIAVAKIKDIQENYTLDTSDLARVDVSDKEIDEKFLSKAGDVLIAMTGATVGKYAIVPITEYPIYVNQRVGYFNLGKNPTRRLPFLINSMNQSYFRNSIFTLANGAAQPNISNEQINSVQLLIPDNMLIDKFNEIFHPYYKMILINQLENQRLASLRDWLLPMLMNGQVKVGLNK